MQNIKNMIFVAFHESETGWPTSMTAGENKLSGLTGRNDIITCQSNQDGETNNNPGNDPNNEE